MDLDKGEMLLPRLFQQTETGRGALKDFTTYDLIRPANQAGLIPWVNDYIPQWKRNELLQMAQTGRKVAVGFRRINLAMLPPDQCRIVAASRCVSTTDSADPARQTTLHAPVGLLASMLLWFARLRGSGRGVVCACACLDLVLVRCGSVLCGAVLTRRR